MCNDIPKDVGAVEAILVAQQKGWLPVVTVLAKVEGESIEDPNHIHCLWNVPPEVAIAMAMRVIAEMRTAMIEEEVRHAREN